MINSPPSTLNLNIKNIPFSFKEKVKLENAQKLAFLSTDHRLLSIKKIERGCHLSQRAQLLFNLKIISDEAPALRMGRAAKFKKEETFLPIDSQVRQAVSFFDKEEPQSCPSFLIQRLSREHIAKECAKQEKGKLEKQKGVDSAQQVTQQVAQHIAQKERSKQLLKEAVKKLAVDKEQLKKTANRRALLNSRYRARHCQKVCGSLSLASERSLFLENSALNQLM